MPWEIKTVLFISKWAFVLLFKYSFIKTTFQSINNSILSTEILEFWTTTKKQTFFKSGFWVYRRINEVKILFFWKLFYKKRSCATVTAVTGWRSLFPLFVVVICFLLLCCVSCITFRNFLCLSHRLYSRLLRGLRPFLRASKF